ncbi:MAG: dihydrodipicolinate synthase family protein [Sulfolobales archaeon]|nr:dihydrodipicolinate synthase family protein [Sulfolobales archaeon]MCX8198480.1 dihydrodipicolinate synthase family protein [Sulfolobales archaeon]MDW8169555.1 dihydrodipicolinate synthase family protein [Desulfurococcaceae archaeon]
MYEGVIVPVITPTKNGLLYEEGLRNVVNFLIERGIHGFFIAGTYGLGPAMSVNERKKVVEIVVDEVQGSTTTIVMVGSSSLDDSIELAKHAQDIGASAISSVPPFYYAYDEKSILSFFKALLNNVNIPVFAYNNPARTGNPLSAKLLNKLANEGVAGLKDSSFDIIKFYEFITTVEKKDFIFIIGTEALMFPGILAGARGCISGLANAFPEIVLEEYELIKQRRYEEAALKQLQIIKIREVIHRVPTIPAIFEILRMRGIDVGYPKPPYRSLEEHEIKALEESLMALNIS